uniref:EF-hand domain-containing protein n=1 Tax=Rhabditophanes sp. KR3021 TaxID=114890 RepID=A0AC35TJ40_9BILA
MTSPPVKTNGTSPDLDEVSLKQIKEAFDMCDEASNGYIPIKKLKVVMRALGFEPRQAEVDKLVEELVRIAGKKEAFKDCFDVTELAQLLRAKFEKCEMDESNSELKSAFRMFDKDQKGYINFDDLKRVVAELGENLKDEELLDMIKEADITKKGHVNETDFMNMMKKTSLY